MLLRDFLQFCFHRSFIYYQNHTIQIFWLQPLQGQCKWPTSGTYSGRHRGDNFCCVQHPGSPPNWMQGQPCRQRSDDYPLLLLYIWIINGNRLRPDLKMTSSCCQRGFYFSSKGSIILDPDVDVFQEMEHLCKMCKAICANRQTCEARRSTVFAFR